MLTDTFQIPSATQHLFARTLASDSVFNNTYYNAATNQYDLSVVHSVDVNTSAYTVTQTMYSIGITTSVKYLN